MDSAESLTKLKRSLPLIIYLFARVPLLLALPFDGLRGYGDLLHFFNLASIPGLPFLNYWVEFPPGFAFLNELIFAVAGGVEHVFTYLFVLLLLAADIGNVMLFTRIEKVLYPQQELPGWRSLLYAALIAALPYTWWYFDSLVVFFTLLALYLILTNRKAALVGTVIGLGILMKLFPALLLPALARRFTPRRFLAAAGAALLVFFIPLFALYQVSSEFTRASLASQSSRGSVATLWAVIDGNYRSGGFGPLVERLDPALAFQSFRNPAVVPPYLALVLFGAAGLALFLRARLDSDPRFIAFYGLTAVLFFLWSTGWSPQWSLHLLPIALLILPISPGLLLIGTFLLANLLEWPLLLSRGLFNLYPVTILLRLFLFLLLGAQFYRQLFPSAPPAVTRPV